MDFVFAVGANLGRKITEIRAPLRHAKVLAKKKKHPIKDFLFY
jgi:hypothetical protein